MPNKTSKVKVTVKDNLQPISHLSFRGQKFVNFSPTTTKVCSNTSSSTASRIASNLVKTCSLDWSTLTSLALTSSASSPRSCLYLSPQSSSSRPSATRLSIKLTMLIWHQFQIVNSLQEGMALSQAVRSNPEPHQSLERQMGRPSTSTSLRRLLCA